MGGANRFHFRAWDKSHQDMGQISGWVDDMNGRLLHVYWEDAAFNDEVYQNENHVIMQSTGLCDRNGKEIFEGDVVRVNDSFRLEVHCVQFGNGTYDSGVYNFLGWHLGYDHSAEDLLEPQRIEVIGNIYENSDLTKPD